MLTDRMTHRQIAIVRALCAGTPVAEVAAAFGVKPATIAAHRAVAMSRTPKGTTLADVCRELDGNTAGPAADHPTEAGQGCRSTT